MGWTKEQQSAIDTRDRTLLVSAAAGSGKTATLTERIIQTILQNKNADISRMLIATYTNAAVDELKDRIEGAIKEAVKNNPNDTRLEKQLLHLKDAKILTITSFCNEILKSSAESIGLPPNYRIAEPPEAKILSSATLEALINAAYEGELPEVCTADEFIDLADCLSNVKYSEGLSKTIAYIFDKLTYAERGIDTLLPFVEEYNPQNFTSVEKTRYGSHIMALTNSIFAEYEKAYGKVIRMAGAERVDEKNLPTAEAEYQFIKACAACTDYSQLRDHLLLFRTKKPTRSGKDPITDFYQSWKIVHSYLVKDVSDITSAFFAYTQDDWRNLYIKLYNLLGTLYRFLKKYYTVFAEDKRRRGICEFSDVERYAYEALYDKDGNITDLARELSEKFDAVYVDEYQDVNGLQSKVFSAISKENNRFMVGDIKQSIYCFRSARPEIFAGMKDTFPILGTAGDYPCASIFMSNNFRCDEQVVDFVNGIFDRMFGMLSDSIGYKPEDRLKFSKIYKDGAVPIGFVPEIHIVNKPAPAPKGEEDAAEATVREVINSARAQARCIAKKISELTKSGHLANGDLITAGDVAILLYSVKGPLATALSEELKALGIASSVAEISDLFMCEEVLLAISFLSAIDNPQKDIYLTAVMLSPVFGFTADEVYKIRRSYEYESLWECVLAYVADTQNDGKCRHFVTSLLRYRKLAEGMPTDALISMLYRESGLLALAAREGGKDNLMLLHSYARKYEQSDFKGIHSFISYINNLIENEEKFPAASSAEEANAVRIMTIHKSKGLEFPVTFIAGAELSLGGSGDSRMAFSENFGISMKTKDKTGLALVDNPTFNAIKYRIEEGDFDEKLRVLYVALTRAREMLYVYGTCTQKNTDEYLETIEATRDILSPYFATKAKSFLDIVLLARSCGHVVIESADGEQKPGGDDGKNNKTDAAQNDSDGIGGEDSDADTNDGDSDADTHDGNGDESNEAASVQSKAAEDAKEEISDNIESVYSRLKKRFGFRNPREHLEILPEKLSVSKLSPNVLDGTEVGEYSLEDLLRTEGIILENPFEADNGEADEECESEQPALTKGDTDESASTPSKLPSFITGIPERESAKRGIATHTVMQFCDFNLLETQGVASELERLCKLEFISREDAARVRINELNRFIKSPLFAEIKNAKQLYRELRFNVKLPADKFTDDEERKKLLSGSEVLVQGVIDCIIEREDGSLHLIDYKTDRLKKKERDNPALGEDKLRLAHTRQLSYYCDAIKQMFGKVPVKVGVYSLHLGKEVEIFV